MERGVVRKVLVCFFRDAAEHGGQAPVERVAFDVRVEEDGDGSVNLLNLQVRSLHCVWFLPQVSSACYCYYLHHDVARFPFCPSYVAAVYVALLVCSWWRLFSLTSAASGVNLA